MKVHYCAVADGQDETSADPARGANGAEEKGRAEALIMGRGRACSALGPSARDLVLLPDPGLVLLPDLYRGAARNGRLYRRDLDGKVFLNATAASGSWA